MKSLLVVFHSRTGGTRQMAEAALHGAAAEAGTATRLLAAEARRLADGAGNFLFVVRRRRPILLAATRAAAGRCGRGTSRHRNDLISVDLQVSDSGHVLKLHLGVLLC